MKNTNLSVIVTCYKKPNQEVKRCLDSLVETKNKAKLDIYFLYNSDKEFDYQWVKDSYPQINVQHVDDDYKKTKKIIKAIKEIDTKYFFVIDPDDWVDSNGLVNFINYISKESVNADVFTNSYFATKYNSKFFKFFIKRKVEFAVWTSIYKTEKFKKIDWSKDSIELIDNTYPQDLTIALYFLDANPDAKWENINIPFYYYQFGSQTSEYQHSNKAQNLEKTKALINVFHLHLKRFKNFRHNGRYINNYQSFIISTLWNSYSVFPSMKEYKLFYKETMKLLKNTNVKRSYLFWANLWHLKGSNYLLFLIKGNK